MRAGFVTLLMLNGDTISTNRVLSAESGRDIGDPVQTLAASSVEHGDHVCKDPLFRSFR